MNRPVPPEGVLALLGSALQRIADAVERWAPPAPAAADFGAANAYVWNAAAKRLDAVPRVNRVEMVLLKGIDRMRDTLVENT
jgi:predicted AAA+ superfamily ATPase